jgi:hypothetical protein
MTDPFVVVGGDAAGLSAASKYRREAPDREVVVFEKGDWVSYALCGMPYFVKGEVASITDLLSLSPEDLTLGTSAGFVLGSTTSLLLAVTFLYLLPAALANYLATGRLRAAVDVDVLGRAATHAAYFYDVTVGLVVGSLLLVVASATTAIAVGFFVAFYAELVAVAFWARGVSRALPGVAAEC